MTRKGRPPTLALKTPAHSSKAVVELVHSSSDDDDEDNDGFLQLSPASSLDSPIDGPPHSPDADELSKDLAVLEQLRRSVHKNLRLRPIRSSNTPLRALHDLAAASSPPHTPWSTAPDRRSPSPSSSTRSPESVYYTPLTDHTPRSAVFYSADWRSPNDAFRLPAPSPLSPAVLISRLNAPTRPLLIDTRPLPSFHAARLPHSINIAIPSLILKRCRKPAGAFPTLAALRQFITTEDGKRIWDDHISPAPDHWDGDLILYDDAMDEHDRLNPQATAWALLSILQPLLPHGAVDYLEGGFAAARHHPYLRRMIVSDADGGAHPDTSLLSVRDDAQSRGGGLFQLDISSATARSRTLPAVEQSLPSPQPMMPATMHHPSYNVHTAGDYATPSPPPSQVSFTRPRKPSIPALRRLDTASAERLNGTPKLQVRTAPSKAATLSVPPSYHPPSSPSASSFRSRSRSPSHLSLTLSESPPSSAMLLTSSGSDLPSSPSSSWASYLPHTPRTPTNRSPSTARPDSAAPLSTEEPFPEFTVSTILPNFLYLGPELTVEEHVEELLGLGVKRILNLAAECDDDAGLRLRERFERYVRIPMRDTVEEDNMTRGVQEVCEILDDARLHSAPTYVHCKAGKSRSVTAVMAYLIHANHWTLSRAYTFVLERRKGISPNIGFVSELMAFEERELGEKSGGVVKPEADAEEGGAAGEGANYQVALGGRRPQHVRESLPPLFSSPHSFGASSTGPAVADEVGDVGQEVEIKDASGRYRHARRAPVNEATLQPMRRVSKAGLESAVRV